MIHPHRCLEDRREALLSSILELNITYIEQREGAENQKVISHI